ncbi:MAG TPA: GNAT family N-acetyltransferase [Solirubrobacteraceae bacterium]|nr:GNAT family N-acetyltransferase [Solirubrobacteraceae bacterium]
MTLPIDTRDFQLRDGRIVRVRPMRPTDRAIYARAVVDLSPRSRYLRFLAPIAKPSERLLDQMTQTDGHRHVAFIALSVDEASVLGVVRYVRTPGDPQAGEVAIAVADDWQGRGLGLQLLRHTIEHARLAGLEALAATTLRENWGATRLLQASGFSPTGSDGPYSEHLMQLGRGPLVKPLPPDLREYAMLRERHAANLDIVHSIFALWERGDFSAVGWAHPEIEYAIVDEPGTQMAKGVAAMTRTWRDFLSAWESYRVEAHEYRALDEERVLVTLRALGRGKASGLDIGQTTAGPRSANIFHVRGGEVIRLTSYFNRDRALADLGLLPTVS